MGEWVQYAFPRPRGEPGEGQPAVIEATGFTEEDTILEMARCVREIGEGRVPEVVAVDSATTIKLALGLLATSGARCAGAASEVSVMQRSFGFALTMALGLMLVPGVRARGRQR